jgi:hypothetical protein
MVPIKIRYLDASGWDLDLGVSYAYHLPGSYCGRRSMCYVASRRAAPRQACRLGDFSRESFLVPIIPFTLVTFSYLRA